MNCAWQCAVENSRCDACCSTLHHTAAPCDTLQHLATRNGAILRIEGLLLSHTRAHKHRDKERERERDTHTHTTVRSCKEAGHTPCHHPPRLMPRLFPPPSLAPPAHIGAAAHYGIGGSISLGVLWFVPCTPLQRLHESYGAAQHRYRRDLNIGEKTRKRNLRALSIKGIQLPRLHELGARSGAKRWAVP